MNEKGYIKFNLIWEKIKVIDKYNIDDLNLARTDLYQKGLIGEYDNGIGFGNISKRYTNNSFIISGSQTGGFPELMPEHFSLVTRINIKENRVHCKGLYKASSESMTHGIIYKIDSSVNYIIHCHSMFYWEILVDKIPTTKDGIEYGTPAMANDIKRLFKETDLKEKKIFVMKGHPEGIVSFGNTIKEAMDVLLNGMYVI